MKKQRGQGLVEYVLMLMVVAGLVSLLMVIMPRMLNALEKPLKEDFARAYTYGDPASCGYREEDIVCNNGPTLHPRVWADGSFKLFGRKD